MIHVFLFDEVCRASAYGIGTYVQQLAECLSQEENISLNVVKFHTDKKELEVERRSSYNIYYFPDSLYSQDKRGGLYYRNVAYILLLGINIQKDDRLVFHLNYYEECSLIRVVKEHFPRCKVIFTIHYQEWNFFLGGDQLRLKEVIEAPPSTLKDMDCYALESYKKEKSVLEAVDKVVCLSSYTYNLLLTHFKLPGNKIQMIKNALNITAPLLTHEERQLERERMYVSEKEKIILFVGRLNNMKNVDLLIKAFKLVVKEYPDSLLFLVGDGKYAVYLKECYGYWNKIVFTGLLPKEDVYKLYQLADVGVLLSSHEQCSYVIMEMMHFALPIIATASPGLKEMVEDYPLGSLLIYDKQQEEVEFLENLKNLMIKKMFSEVKTDNHKKDYAEQYSYTNIKGKYMELYQNIP